jgi:3-dehydroquinate dehydratase
MHFIKLFLAEMDVFAVKEIVITTKEETQCGTGGLVAVKDMYQVPTITDMAEKIRSKLIDLEVNLLQCK